MPPLFRQTVSSLGLLLLAGCVNIPLASIQTHEIRLYNRTGDGRPALDIINQTDIFDLEHLFDSTLTWRSPQDGDQVFSAQGRSLYTIGFEGDFDIIPIFITEDKAYKRGMVADLSTTFHEQFETLTAPHLFKQDPDTTYEVWVDDAYYDPTSVEALRNAYSHRASGPRELESQMVIYNEQSTYPEIKQPVLRTEDRSLLSPSAKGIRIQLVVLDDGEIVNIEILDTSTQYVADSIYRYIDSLYYTPGLMESNPASYRITRKL